MIYWHAGNMKLRSLKTKTKRQKQIASVPSTAKRRLSTNNLHIDTLIIGTTTCLDSHVTMSEGLRTFQIRSTV